MNDSNCPPFPELPPPSYGSNMVGAGKGNKKPPLPSVDSSMGSFSTRLGFTIDPLPMPDEARFTPGKVFQDVWASVLFLVHLMGVFALGVWLLQPASLSKFEWISNTFPNSGSVFNFYIEDLLILGLGWGFSVVFLLLYFTAMQKFPLFLIKFSFWASLAVFFIGGVCLFTSMNTSQKVFFFIFVAWLLFIWFGIRRLVPFTAVLLRAVINIIKKYSGPFWCNLIIFFIGFSYVVFLILLALVAQRTFLNYPASETPFEHHLVAGCVFAYLLFSFYWTLQVLKNVAHVTVAGAFASYYFSNPAMDRFPTLNALKRALTTSFGSICYGSLIISMIQWLHVVIKEGFQWSSNDGNQVSSFIFCCLECLNNFIEDCAQPLNTYTFIQVAMYGKPYQRAAKDTWRLIRDRGVDVLINNLCIEIVLGIGFCFVCILTVFTTMATCYIFSLSDLEWDFSINPILIGGVIGGGTLVYLFSEIIRTGVSTTMVVLAEDPLALKNSKPELWEEIRRVYPEVAYISMYHL